MATIKEEISEIFIKDYVIAISKKNHAGQLKKELENQSRISILAIKNIIARQVNAGLTDNQIVDVLVHDVTTGGQIFGSIKNQFKSASSTSLGTLANDSFQTVVEQRLPKIKLFVWVAMLINSCKSCIEYHGQVRLMSEWREKAIPRVRGTVCGGHCQCELLPYSGAIVDDVKNMGKPIKLQRKKIAEYREIQDHKLSRSYRKQLLGQANNPDGVVSRTVK